MKHAINKLKTNKMRVWVGERDNRVINIFDVTSIPYLTSIFNDILKNK